MRSTYINSRNAHFNYKMSQTTTNLWPSPERKLGKDLDKDEAMRLSRGWGLRNVEMEPTVIDLTLDRDATITSVKNEKKRKRSKLSQSSRMSVSLGDDDTWSETPDSVSFDEDFKDEFLPFLEKWMNQHGKDYIENWLIRQDLKLCTGHLNQQKESSKLIQQPSTEKPSLTRNNAFSFPRLVSPLKSDAFGQNKNKFI